MEASEKIWRVQLVIWAVLALFLTTVVLLHPPKSKKAAKPGEVRPVCILPTARPIETSQGSN